MGWQHINGTVVNALTVALGSAVGLLLSGRMPQRYQQIVLSALGLMTITLGIDAAVIVFGDTVARFKGQVRYPDTYGARLAMVMIGSLIPGCILGTLLGLHQRIEGFGTWVHVRFGGGGNGGSGGDGGHRFAEGFLTASVIFCVGPLTLLGCLRNGSQGDPGYLYIKSALDGFCSMALASTLGWGVMLSVVTVIGFQGGLSVLAYLAADPLPEVSRSMMAAVGGVLMLGTALMILDVKKIPVADMLPAVFLPPAIIAGVEVFWPGMLLPAS